MAHPESLISGNCYFLVNYFDSDLLLPSIHTLVYLYSEKSDDNRELWIFEEPCSIAPQDEAEEPDDSDGEAEQPIQVAFDEDNLYQVLDFQGLLKKLNEVAGFHPLHPTKPVATCIGISDAVSTDLRQQIEKFLAEETYVSISITIRFTDDGFSLGRRREGGFEIGFFPKPKIDPDEERRIRKIFEKIGVCPHEDYLADKGRTRILEFSIPDNSSYIMNLCDQILTDAYSIRTKDSLKYCFLTYSQIGK